MCVRVCVCLRKKRGKSFIFVFLVVKNKQSIIKLLKLVKQITQINMLESKTVKVLYIYKYRLCSKHNTIFTYWHGNIKFYEHKGRRFQLFSITMRVFQKTLTAQIELAFSS